MFGLLFSIVAGFTLIGLASADRRLLEGKPLLPAFSVEYLPWGSDPPDIQELDIDLDDDDTYSVINDPDIDEHVEEWVSEGRGYTSHARGADTHPYAPESIDFQGETSFQKTGNQAETNPETIETSLDVSSQRFHTNAETNPETSSETPYFQFQSDAFDEDEFAVFCDLVDEEGFQENGKAVIYALWGISPGRSYGPAKNKRDMYAKRKNEVSMVSGNI